MCNSASEMKQNTLKCKFFFLKSSNFYPGLETKEVAKESPQQNAKKMKKFCYRKYGKRVTFPAQITVSPPSQKSCSSLLQMFKNPGKKHFYDIYQLIHTGDLLGKT